MTIKYIFFSEQTYTQASKCTIKLTTKPSNLDLNHINNGKKQSTNTKIGKLLNNISKIEREKITFSSKDKPVVTSIS